MSNKLKELNRKRRNPEKYSFEAFQKQMEKERIEMMKGMLDSTAIAEYAKQFVEQNVEAFKTELEKKVAKTLGNVKDIQGDFENNIEGYVKDTVRSLDDSFAATRTSMQEEVRGVKDILKAIHQQVMNLVKKTEDKLSAFFKNAERFRGPKGDPGKQGKQGKKGDKGDKVSLDDIMEKLRPELANMRREVKRTLSSKSGGGGGGGMGSPTTFSFTGDGLSSFTLDTKVAANGLACWAYLNGQWLQPGVHFNISGKTLTLVGFTLQVNDTLEGFYLRT